MRKRVIFVSDYQLESAPSIIGNDSNVINILCDSRPPPLFFINTLFANNSENAILVGVSKPLIIGNERTDNLMLISVDAQSSRRPLDLLRFVEHLRSHRDVYILPSGGDGSKGAAVPLVEEISDRLPNAAVHCHHGPRLPVALHRVQLPEGVRLVDRPARRHVPLPVQGVLPAELSAEETQEVDDERRRQGRSSIKGQARERRGERGGERGGEWYHERRRERLLAHEEGCRRLLREGRKPSDGAQSPEIVCNESRVTL